MTMIRPRANTYSDIVQPQHSCKFVEALHTTAFLQMSRMSASGSLEDESPLRSPAVLRPTGYAALSGPSKRALAARGACRAQKTTASWRNLDSGEMSIEQAIADLSLA